MRLLFSTTRAGWPIRLFEGGQSSHCACVTADGTVIDATFKRGVKAWTEADWLAVDGRLVTGEYTFPAPDQAAGDAWLWQQVGKGYDFLALGAFVGLQDVEDASRWYCSELAKTWQVKSGVTFADINARFGVRIAQHNAHARAAAAVPIP